MKTNNTGKLYVVATPIGNLADISFRAIEILKSVDAIASEDTRHTLILLKKYEINNKLIAYHKFNEESCSNALISKLLEGQNIALVTDAGTPAISDPGAILVNLARLNDIEVLAIPGPSAVIAALSISGFNFKGFEFLGFFPRQTKDQTETLKKIEDSPNDAFIFYESPNRIIDMLKTTKKHLNDVTVLVCNDLTKMFERSVRGNITQIIQALENDPKTRLGEYVVVLFKSSNKKPLPEDEPSLEAALVDFMIKNDCSVKDAISLLSNDYNKNSLYKASLSLKSLFSLVKQ